MAGHKSLLDISKIGLEQKESLEIAGLTSKAKERYDLTTYKSDTLNQMYKNIYKHFKVFKESNSAVVSSDIEPFRNIAIIATTKFFTQNILDKLVSMQTSDSPYGLITYVDFQYADDHAPDGITAGDSIVKRSKTYGNHPNEQTVSRRMKTTVTHKPIQAGVRSIEASYTLESWLAMASVKGQSEAKNFLDKTYLDVISSKLRDEAEFAVMNALYSACLPSHVLPFSLDGTDCEARDCDSRRFLDTIEEAGQLVYDTHKIWPNVCVVGSDALRIIRRGDTKIINNYEKGTAIPSSVARNYMGVMDDRYGIIYDPELTGALLTWKDGNSNFGASGIYTSVVPLAITSPITERDLSTYRVVYAVDSVDIVHPELIARVDIV